MQLYRIVMGLEISDGYLRAAEVEHRNNEFFLSRVAERKLERFDADILCQALGQLIEEEAFLAKTVSVAIDTRLTERDTIDIDPEMSDDEILSLVKAEVSLHTGMDKDGYKPAYQITRTNEHGYSEVFYAAMRKELLDSLRSACMSCGLDLRFIDIDHSCSEMALNRLSPLREYTIVTVKEQQAEASFCKNGERIVYRSAAYTDDPAFSVVKLVQDVESFADETPDRILLCGSDSNRDLLDLLKSSVDQRYALLEPAQNLVLSHFISTDERIRDRSYLYTAVIGAALK